MSQPHHELPIDPTALVALLDLIERPAAVVSAGGVILGSNAAFLRLAEMLGDPAPSNLRAVLSADSLASVEQASEPAHSPRVPTMLGCVDGLRRSVRLEMVGSVDAPRRSVAHLLVIETSHDDGAWPASTRGEALLRHELAGPLTAILGTAEMILMREPNLPRGTQEGIGQILDNCARMAKLLSVSRLREDSDPRQGIPDEF